MFGKKKLKPAEAPPKAKANKDDERLVLSFDQAGALTLAPEVETTEDEGPPSAVPGGAEVLSLQSEEAAELLEGMRRRDQLHRLEFAQRRAEVDLEKLGSRLNLASQKALRPVLMALHADPQGAVLQFQEEGKVHQVPCAEQLMRALEALPENKLHRFGEMGGEDDPDAPSSRDPRTDAERRHHRSVGIDDERVVELSERYPQILRS